MKTGLPGSSTYSEAYQSVRNLTLAVVLVALFAIAACTEDAIPPGTVTAIKAATVFVKVDVECLSGSGSGFVVKTEGNRAYVVTNHHVIEPRAMQLVLVPSRRPTMPYRTPRRPDSRTRPYRLRK